MYRLMALLALICSFAASLSAADDDRSPAPPTADIKKATELVRELFKEDYARTGLKAKKELAEKLFKQAEETNDDPAARFALFAEAADVAAAGGDATLAIEAINAIHERFTNVKAEATEGTLKNLATKAAGADALNVANHLLKVTDDAVTAADLEAAERMVKLAETAATRSKNIRAASLASARAKDVEQFKKDAPAIKAALEKLEKSPTDAAAATVAGRYYCFQRGEWEKGIPLLVGADDAKLKAVAEKEAEGAKEGTDLLAIADGWYDVAATTPAHLKRAAQGRAFSFYTKAAPDLTGLNRTRADKRIDELEKVVTSAHSEEFWNAVRSAVRNKDVEELKPVGFPFGDVDYRDNAPPGGVLIGFNYTLGKFVNNDVIGALQPIYMTPTGEKLGTALGKMAPKPLTVKAKPGYAVASITFRTGLGFDAFHLTYMRIVGKGFSQNDKYDSVLIGGKGGGEQPPLGDARPIVALHGKKKKGDDQPAVNMGLVLAGPKPNAVPKKP